MSVVLLAALLGCDPRGAVSVSPANYAPLGGYDVSAIAANADGAIGIWRHTHAGFGSFTYLVSGAILDREGAPTEPAQKSFHLGSPWIDIATDGRNYLVAGSTSARIVGPTGEDLSPRVSYEPGGFVRAVWNGDAYVVLAGSTLAVISPAGELISTRVLGDGLALAPAGRGRVLVMWRSGGEVQLAFFDGTLSTPRVMPDATEFSVATDGDGFLLAARRGNVQVQWLDAAGVPIRPPLAFDAPGNTRAVRALWDGDAYLVLWANNAVRIAGDVVSVPFEIGGELSSAAAAPGGTIILLRGPCSSISSTFLPRGATRGTSPRDVSTEAIPKQVPVIVSTRSGFQVTWGESLIPDVRCGSISRLMTKSIGRDPIRLSSDGASFGDYAMERVGDTTFVIWDEYAGGMLPGVLRVARLDADGALLSNEVLATGRFFFGLQSAVRGSELVVAWQQERESIFQFDVYVATLSESKMVSEPSDDPLWMILAAGETQTLVAWLNHAFEIVSIDRAGQRHVMPLPTNTRSFIAAGVSGDDAIIIARADEGLIAIDPFRGVSKSLGRGGNPTGRVVPDSDGWTFFFADGEEESAVNAMHINRDLTPGPERPSFCVPARPHATAFALDHGRITAVAYVGGTEIYFRPIQKRLRVVTKP